MLRCSYAADAFAAYKRLPVLESNQVSSTAVDSSIWDVESAPCKHTCCCPQESTTTDSSC